MYTVKYWLITLKEPIVVNDKEFTMHFIADTQEDARRMAEEKFGLDKLACDPVLDQTVTYSWTNDGVLTTGN